MISPYWCIGNYGSHSWKLSIKRLKISVIIKERKYSLISPFWLETVIEDFI